MDRPRVRFLKAADPPQAEVSDSGMLTRQFRGVNVVAAAKGKPERAGFDYHGTARVELAGKCVGLP